MLVASGRMPGACRNEARLSRTRLGWSDRAGVRPDAGQSSRLSACARKPSASYIKRVFPQRPPASKTRFEKGAENADRAALHQRGTIALRGHRFPPHRERNPQSGRLRRLSRRRRRSAGALVAGRLRRAGAEVFPQGRRARAPEEGRGGDRSLLAVAQRRRRRRAQGAAREGALHRRDLVQAGVRPARRHLDLLGLEGRLLLPRKPTRKPSSTSTATCWRCRWRRRIRRNGSTPACTGPTASTARARATSTSISRPASSCNRPPLTSIRSRTPASSSRSPTTSSTRAASWICGCARRGCSNTAPAPARISPSCAAPARSSPAAASRRA